MKILDSLSNFIEVKRRQLLLFFNFTSSLFFLLSSIVVYNSFVEFSPDDLYLNDLDLELMSESEFKNYLWTELSIKDSLQAVRFDNIMSSIQPDISKYYKTNEREILVFRLKDKSWVSIDPEVGKILRKSKKNNRKRAKRIEVNGFLNDEISNSDLIAEIEPLLRNSFDIWNDKLKGEINLLPPIKDHQYLNKFGAIHFKLNGVNKKYYFINTKTYAGYINEKGIIERNEFYNTPVLSSIISSRYDIERLHPVTKVLKPHFGTDYAGNRGDPIFSIGTGTVIKVGRDSRNGKYIKIKHDKHYSSQYLHLETISEKIDLGSKVDKGQIIGSMGSSGLTTGVHLCFRFWFRDVQIDHKLHKQMIVDQDLRVDDIELQHIRGQYSIFE